MSRISVINDVRGFDERINTIGHLPPTSSTCNRPGRIYQGHVIFFPGDIQDFAEKMKVHYLSKDYIQWSYETTMYILLSKFPLCHIWLIAPSQKAGKSIAIFKNFVESDSLLGIPSHSSTFNGLQHLELLFNNMTAQIGEFPRNLVLIGFSKGCVVLNQFLYELSHLAQSTVNKHHSTSSPSEKFVKEISAMVWLDGGHSGEEDTWITSSSVISALSYELCCHILFSIHVTPYQVRDDHRPWKGRSKSQFVDLLRQNSLKFNDKFYFEDDEVTIDMHFNILNNFNDLDL